MKSNASHEHIQSLLEKHNVLILKVHLKSPSFKFIAHGSNQLSIIYLKLKFRVVHLRFH